jgi:hypothetical protein
MVAFMGRNQLEQDQGSPMELVKSAFRAVDDIVVKELLAVKKK